MGDSKPKYLIKGLLQPLAMKSKNRLKYLTTRLVAGSVSKGSSQVRCPYDERLLRLICQERYCLHAASKMWHLNVDRFVSCTHQVYILNDENRNLLHYSLLTFPLLTLRKILLVSYMRVCQFDESVKVTLCCTLAKQNFWFGVSCIKHKTLSQKCCSQDLAVLPWILGQCN